MGTAELNLLAWDLLPTLKGDCWSKCMQKQYERNQMVKRAKAAIEEKGSMDKEQIKRIMTKQVD